MNKRLYRSRKDRMIGGVAAGLADYFDIDVTLVRVIFVIILFLGGSGILAYIILWIVMPEEPITFPSAGQETNASAEGSTKTADSSAYFEVIDNRRQKRRVFAGIILVIIGLLFLADNFIPRIHFGDFWPLVLVAIGVALLLNAKKNNKIL